MNCAQTLVQVVYWWHPLVWLANSRIRRAREEAVDDAVMVALHRDAETYAPTLIEVARYALRRPLVSLGLVGILESRSSLKQRIERLIDFRAPAKAGLTLASLVCVFTFGAVALPMGKAPAQVQRLLQQNEFGAADSDLSSTPHTSAGAFSPETNTPVMGKIPVLGDLPLMARLFRNGSNDLDRAPAAEEPTGSDLEGNASARKTRVAMLVQDGKLLFEMGKLEEAKKKLQEAVRDDPQNQRAYYYLNLINETNNRQDIDSRDGLPDPNFFSRPSPGHQRLQARLDQIRLDNVSYDDLPLTDVLKMLTDEAQRRDPTRQGINFCVDPNPAVDMSQIRIKIVPALQNVRLVDVLDAVVKVADRPIEYSVEDYAVVFSLKSKGNEPLYTRMIKVDPNTFVQGLDSVVGFEWGTIARGGGGGSINSGLRGVTRTNDMTFMVRQFFFVMGVDLNPPKSVFWNDREGALLVRATLRDLDTIETTCQALNTPPAQVNSKILSLTKHQSPDVRSGTNLTFAQTEDAGPFYVRAIKVDPDTFLAGLHSAVPGGTGSTYVVTALREILLSQGVDLRPPRSVFWTQGEGALVFRATLQELDTIEVTVGFLNTPPQQINIKAKILELSEAEAKSFWQKYSGTKDPAALPWTVELSASEAERELGRWQTLSETNFLSRMNATTLSGRQVQMQVSLLIHVLTATNSQPTLVPIGQTVNLFPVASSDLFKVVLSGDASDTEFLGYDDPGKSWDTKLQNGDAVIVPRDRQAQLPLPHFQIRKLQLPIPETSVWDGHTLVLGYPVDADGRPVEKPGDGKKRLLVLLTPTLIDPAGNRLHTDEEVEKAVR